MLGGGIRPVRSSGSGAGDRGVATPAAGVTGYVGGRKEGGPEGASSRRCRETKAEVEGGVGCGAVGRGASRGD